MQQKWWKEAVVYQIYPRSFYDSNGDGIGDLPGITAKLDYLKYLGVDVLWLSPVYASPNDDNGYDIADYCQIMKDFGTMADFDELLMEAHRRGLKIIMDLVVNHTSDEHPWFIESRSSKDNPKRDFYIWRKGRNGSEPNNWRSYFTTSAWEYDERTSEYYLHLFSRKQPDLNWENPAVKTEIFKMMRWWLDKGIDGFRMDVINMLCKAGGFPDSNKRNTDGDWYVLDEALYTNQPGIHELLLEMNERVLRDYEIMTVGETPNVTPETASLYVAEERHELNMVFQFELMGIDSGPGGKWDRQPWRLADLKSIITKWQQGLEDRGWNSLYLNNHDQPRIVSRFGNDRSYRLESAKLLATLLHTLQGTPYIYQGEEIGMTNVAFKSIDDYRDIETLNMYREQVIEKGDPLEDVMLAIHTKSRDNARTPIQWNDQANAGFSTTKPWIKVNPNYPEINVEQAMADPDSIFHYYRRLIQLRKENPIIVYGDYIPLSEEEPQIFAYLRTWHDQYLLVVSNFSAGDVCYEFPEVASRNERKLLIANYQITDKAETIVKLRPYEARVYRL